MSVDIITYNPDVFYKVCTTCNIPSDIVQKYAQLFASYECFSKLPTAAPNAFNKSKVSKSFPHDNDRRRKESSLRLHEKPLHKALIGLLNILNNTNYTKVLTKIKILSSTDNITTICDSIIKKGVMEPMYCSLFVRLLDDVAKSLSYQKEVQTVVNNFMDDFVSNKLVYLKSPTHTDDYSEFCAEQKHKTCIISANAFILQLFIKTSYVSLPIASYIGKICGLLKFYITNWDDFHVDMLLHVLIDIGKSFKSEMIQHVDDLQSLSKVDHIKNNVKIGFLTETLLSTI